MTKPPQRIPPGPGQESVWDYPRPPRLEPTAKHIQVIFNGVLIADTRQALRVLETSGPPVYYLPPDKVCREFLVQTSYRTFCEWKGWAVYFTVSVHGQQALQAAWSYPEPTSAYAALKDYLAFYAGPMDACLVDGDKVQPQPGAYYGGWITPDIVGPFKGEPGSEGW